VFPLVEMLHDEPQTHYGVKKLEPCDGVQEYFFAIGTEKKFSTRWSGRCWMQTRPGSVNGQALRCSTALLGQSQDEDAVVVFRFG